MDFELLTEIRRWRSLVHVVFVETPTFTKRVLQFMEDDDYSALQTHLAKQPDAGKLIPGSGGMRKFAGREAGEVSVAACG